MKLLSEHYYQAALERIQQARELYENGSSYAASMYLAGVAVECLLRAFKVRKDPTFDERHDLHRLFRTSGFLSLMPQAARGARAARLEGLQDEIQAAANQVCVLWSNIYRFASEQRLRAFLASLGLRAGVKGDILKANALRLLKAAQIVIAMGTRLWTTS